MGVAKTLQGVGIGSEKDKEELNLRDLGIKSLFYGPGLPQMLSIWLPLFWDMKRSYMGLFLFLKNGSDMGLLFAFFTSDQSWTHCISR